MGCTNRPLRDLDAAVLRPGRLEVLIEIGLPSIDDRVEILELATHRVGMTVEPKDLLAVATAADGCSGAELTTVIATV